MASFTRSLLEDGVEVELTGSVSTIIALLDEDVPQFEHQGYRYQVTPASGSIGAHWDLIVRVSSPANGNQGYAPVGWLEVEKVDGDRVLFRIPPSSEQQARLEPGYEHNQPLFGSFVYQVLNSLQQRQLLDLPGLLPVF